MIKKKKRKQYSPLHTHTFFSFRDCSIRINELVADAYKKGFSSIAVTDHGSMHGTMKLINETVKAGRKVLEGELKSRDVNSEVIEKVLSAIPKRRLLQHCYNDAPKLIALAESDEAIMESILVAIEKEVKPIIGVEAYVIPDSYENNADKTLAKKRYHLILLAKSEEGYYQIAKAVCESHKHQLITPKSVFPRMTHSVLEECFLGGDEVIALSGCIQGEVPSLLLAGEYELAKERAIFYEDIFGKGNFYLEIQDHGMEEEFHLLPLLTKLSEETGIKLVATNDAHFLEPSGAQVRDILVANRFMKTIYDENFDKTLDTLDQKTEAQMLKLFPDHEDAVYESGRIADLCNCELPLENKYLVFPLPEGETEKSYLRKLAEAGMAKRYPLLAKESKESQDMMWTRFEYELDIIDRQHYNGYLLSVQDFINYGKSIGMVGPGRGSAAGSLICYLIGITDVDPIKYDLVFERFLNPDRVSAPDIDIDFDETRDEVIEYVKRKYGANKVSKIMTVGTYAARAAIKAVGRALNIPYDICDKIAKMIPQKPGITLDKVLAENALLKEEYDADKTVRRLIDEAKRIEGLGANTGVHPAGIIIADRPVDDCVPLLYDKKKDIWITQLDKDECEADAGLLKMDFLRLENLTTMKMAIKEIKKAYGVDLDLLAIDYEDPRVYKEIFQAGNTKGVFQFESGGMVDLLKRFKPKCFEDIILLVAAYRPGPMQYLEEIINVKRGKKAEYIIPEMEKILGVTYGKPIYQEQIMKIFSDIAGFSLGVADIIRRAMSKKKLKELEGYLPKFQEALIRNGAKIEDAETFKDEMMNFAEYAFNKSHAAAYSVVSYQTAYLKCYYPKEFMAGVLTSSLLKDKKKLPIYLAEARKMGFEILVPCINSSDINFTPVKEGIRFGMCGIKNVGAAGQTIVDEREENGPYKDFEDLIQRIARRDPKGLNKTAIESLIMSGAFSEVSSMNKNQLMYNSKAYIDRVKKLENDFNQNDQICFEGMYELGVNSFRFETELQEYGKEYILEQEFELLSCYLSGHPLDSIKDILEKNADVAIAEIDETMDGSHITVAGQISSFALLNRKTDGAEMGRFVIEDLTGKVDAIAFTKAFAKSKNLIANNAVVELKGKVMVDSEENEFGEVTILGIQISVEEVSVLSANKNIYVDLCDGNQWEEIKHIFEAESGKSDVIARINGKIYSTGLKSHLSDYVRSELVNKKVFFQEVAKGIA